MTEDSAPNSAPPFSSTRRKFLHASSATLAAGLIARPNLLLGQAKGANSRVRVGVMGLSRGRAHIKGYLDVANTEVAYVCDVDSTRLESGFKELDGKQETPPQKVGDYRRILDDPDIDAISIAAPNFWHAIATIQACQAGKHVYVEKPGSYNPYEARKMVEVAGATNRKVQMGNQRRSYPAMIEAVQKLRDGVIGELRYARCWYKSTRPSIGIGKPAPVPDNLNFELWLGPLPDQPYKDNLVHYNWHWHWYYGGGELANNGIHSLDVARWAMGVDYPQRATCGGGRYHFQDDQETPDTIYATYDFGEKGGINFSSSSHHRRLPEQHPFVAVYGDGGALHFSSSDYVIYDLKGKETDRRKENPSDVPHFTNFVDGIRNGDALNSDIGDAQISTMLCHLGNIAYRTSGGIEVDPQNGDILDNPEAMKLWQREAYRDGWAI